MQHYSQCVEVTTDGFDVVFIIRFLSSFFVWDLATFGDWHMFHYMGENNSIAPTMSSTLKFFSHQMDNSYFLYKQFRDRNV